MKKILLFTVILVLVITIKGFVFKFTNIDFILFSLLMLVAAYIVYKKLIQNK